MSILDKLKKVALTGHSVTLGPQSVIEIADLLGEVRDAYSEAHEQIKDLESKLAAAHDVRDSWKRRAWDAEESLASITSDVEAINNALGDSEWGEHCTTTPQGQTLEGFITALVGNVTELREKMKQPATDHKKRLVNLIEGRTHNWTYGEGEGNASKGDAFAVEVVPLYEHPAQPVKLAKDLKLSDKAHRSHCDYAEGYNDRAEMDRAAIRAAGYQVEGEPFTRPATAADLSGLVPHCLVDAMSNLSLEGISIGDKSIIAKAIEVLRNIEGAK